MILLWFLAYVMLKIFEQYNISKNTISQRKLTRKSLLRSYNPFEIYIYIYINLVYIKIYGRKEGD